ncbi:MATE family efflux transporter [Mariniphaga sediminis]|uniref:Multidrug-efflux transporter n=1 Tax=Mariniphaga sediminis TaxID=1628158 RepID=A0A399D3R5_9BACT|nr:MATE family efflux transporter [Mariniphaga sediminis]RIH65838.1 MATE family efflux transporter [Mariniphaga sediminis]
MSVSKRGKLSQFSIRISQLKLLWKDIKEAIGGTERDFTESRLGHAIFILAVPMVLEMIMESVFAVVDIFFVSRLGAGAVATVGITESVMTIVYAIGSGLSMATTALVARRIGEKRKNEAGVVAFQAILLGVFVALLIALPGILFAKEFLLLMGATEEMAEEGVWYPVIMFGGNVVIMLLFIINAIFRSSGDAAISMRVVWLANIVNLVLDPLLIFGIGPFPELGLAGAAIATTIGRALAVVYQFYLLFRGNYRIKLYRESIRFRLNIVLELLKISGGGILQNLIATSSWILLVRIIAVSGPEALAGYTIAIRIILFSILPAWGLSNAASTLVGQNLGAKHPERAEKAVWITGYINVVFMGIIGTVLILFPEFFIRLFVNETIVLNNGILALRIISFGFISYALGMVLIQGFNGSGDTFTPTKINIVCFWLIEIPLAYLLAITLKMGLSGASIAIVASESLLTIIALIYFRKGKWKLKEV